MTVIGKHVRLDGKTYYNVAVYEENSGHWETTVTFRSKLLATLFHIILNRSANHVGSRYA